MNPPPGREAAEIKRLTFDVRTLSAMQRDANRTTVWFTAGISAMMIALAAFAFAMTAIALSTGGSDPDLPYKVIFGALALSVGVYFAFITRLGAAHGPDTVTVDEQGVRFGHAGAPERICRWSEPHLRIVIKDYGAAAPVTDPRNPGIAWTSPAPPLVPLTRDALSAITSAARNLGMKVSSEPVPHPSTGAPHVRWTVTASG